MGRSAFGYALIGAGRRVLFIVAARPSVQRAASGTVRSAAAAGIAIKLTV
jgi:hypothetical protein